MENSEIKVGCYQTLTVLYKKDFGVFLGRQGDEKGILLPKKQVPEDVQVGDDLNVFIYKDSEDRVIATTKRPKLTMGEMAVLEIKEITRIGAFLDWGMEKDLLLPFKEQTGKINVGDSVLVSMYLDKSERLCATMNVYKKLRSDSPYRAGDEVVGTVYSINPKIGVFVAVDNKYCGMIPNQAMYRKYRMGGSYSFFVAERRNDGKLNLSEAKKAYQQMDVDAEKVMQTIEDFGGELPFGEKVDPEVIKREFSMSKAAFKRALSKLYREEKIVIEDNRIYKV